MTDLLRCHPEHSKFPTTPDARKYISLDDGRKTVAHCLTNHLQPLLRSQPWEKVYLIGSQALRYVAERDSMMDWGGTPLPIPHLDPERRLAVATIHPAALMRDAALTPLVYCDLKRPLEIPPENYCIHPTVEQVRQFTATDFTFDIETDYPDNPDKITMIAFSVSPTYAWVVPWREPFIAEMRRIFGAATRLWNQNIIQFDIPHVFRELGLEWGRNWNGEVRDTMLLHHLLWPTLPHDLGMLGRQFLTKPFWKNWRGDGAAEETYACRDADGTHQIGAILWRELEREPRLRRLYEDVQVPVARICHLMTEIGIMTDPAAAQRVADEATALIAREELHLPVHMRPKMLSKRRKVAAPAGTLSPPKYGKKGQLLKQKPVAWLYEPYEVQGPAPWVNGPRTAAFLYGELGLKERLDPEGKVTTGKKTLTIIYSQVLKDAKLAHHAPVVNAIRLLRMWKHRQGICRKLTKGAAKRIHASFNVHGTNTGRLSSTGGDTKVQMQNITEEMRVLFVPSQPGWKLWSVDFSQMEARLAAWFAKDIERAARFDLPGFNEYKLAASIFLGIPAADVPKDKAPDSPYHKAKTIVLGTDRALGAHKISIQNDIPEAEVKEMLVKWKAMIPVTMEWQRETGNRAKREKLLWSPFGRRGLFYGGNEYTEGISYLPQSTGADVLFRCMIALMYERIRWPRASVERVVRVIRPLPEPARLLLQVHDELVGECPEAQIDEVREVLTEVLSQPWPELNGLRLPVNFSCGDNWFEMDGD